MSRLTVAKVALAITRGNLLSAMEYRASFLTQVIGMVVNDIGLIGLWVIFFQKFPTVNGWSFQDSALLFAITTMTFALAMIFLGGAATIAKVINRGELDYFLGLPQDPLWHVSASRTDISAIGDLIFGIAIFFICGEPTVAKFTLFLTTSVLSALVLYSFTVITQSIAFIVPNFEDAAMELFHVLIGFTMYPQSVYYGVLKILTMTLIPAFFLATVPVRIVRQFDLSWLALLAGFSIGAVWLARTVFARGLRHYESGNLIANRV